MSHTPMDENEKKGEPLDTLALIEEIPEEIREQLTDSDLHMLAQVATLKEFRKRLMEVMLKLPDEFAPSKKEFEKMMQQFYSEVKEDEKRMIADLFTRLKRSMVSFTQGVSAEPMMTPRNPDLVQQKKSEKDDRKR